MEQHAIQDDQHECETILAVVLLVDLYDKTLNRQITEDELVQKTRRLEVTDFWLLH